MANPKRERQRARKQQSLDEEFAARLVAYFNSRIVCERCGLEQPFRVADKDKDEVLAPCLGPLGLPCDSETAVWLDSFEMNPD